MSPQETVMRFDATGVTVTNVTEPSEQGRILIIESEGVSEFANISIDTLFI